MIAPLLWIVGSLVFISVVGFAIWGMHVDRKINGRWHHTWHR